MTHNELRARCHAGRRRSIFHLLQSDMAFGIVDHFFVKRLCHLQWEKLPDFNASLVNLHWRQDSQVFSGYWILIGQFKLGVSNGPI